MYAFAAQLEHSRANFKSAGCAKNPDAVEVILDVTVLVCVFFSRWRALIMEDAVPWSWSVVTVPAAQAQSCLRKASFG